MRDKDGAEGTPREGTVGLSFREFPPQDTLPGSTWQGKKGSDSVLTSACGDSLGVTVRLGGVE